MKKIAALLLCIILVMSMYFPANASEQEKLSNMTEEECIEFLQQAGVTIPTDYEDKSVWGKFALKIIMAVENDPNTHFYYNYTVTQMFANAIKETVNQYYGIDTSAVSHKNISRASTYVLQDSILITPWNSEFLYYNCYIFAIDKPEENLMPRNPGYFSGNSIDISLPISVLARFVKEDLEALGHERVISDHTIDTSNLCTNEKVICIRKGDTDYHLMKYNGGYWDHKPGNTQILRYKYELSVVRLWTNELVFMNVAYEADTTYDSSFYYISYDGHNWNSYTNHNTGTHTYRCSICGDSETEKCDLEFVSSGSSGHYQKCSLCGYRSVTVAHNMKYSYTSSGKHKGTCSQCGYTTTENCNSSGYQYYGQVDGMHKHRTACSKCSHVTDTTLISCLFKGTSTVCSHCKHDKGISGGTIMKKPGDGAVQPEQE